MPGYAYIIIGAGWIIWFVPFVRAQRSTEPAKELNRNARWGMLLAGVAYALLWENRFWERSLPDWRLALSILFFVLASVLSWSAVRALGRHWRMDAGLISGHELVMSGPYRVVRHPIYASMLCVLLGTGFLVTPLVMLALCALILIAGTEIRVRIEDRLLASRFGEGFQEYRGKVSAYIPFIR